MTFFNAVCARSVMGLLLCLAIAASECAASYSVTWIDNITIVATDGVLLHADAFIPTPTSPSQLFPVIVFPNSWGCPQLEYVVRALHIGERGYVAIEYETRGWWLSGGEIDTAGPLDRDDGGKVLDYIASRAAEWNADMTRIGFAGISYGAGISLMMAGTDPRVKVAVALSGWNNLTDFAYGEHSPNYMQTQTLLNSAKKVGHPSQELFELDADLTNHTNMSFVESFGGKRSPQAFLSTLNQRNVPIFISSNYQDRFFRPQYMLDFWPQLTGPKMMLMNQGGHAVPEGIGLFVNTSFIWNKVFLWWERHLQNISNGIDEQKPMQMQLGDSILDDVYMQYSEDPTSATSTTWYMTARGSNGAFGGLQAAPASIPTADTVAFTSNPSLISGTKEDIWEAFGINFVTNLTAANRSTTVVYTTAPFTATSLLCGTTSASLTVTSSSASGFQVYGFLYDVPPGPSAQGAYLTESFYTQWHNTPNQSTDVTFRFHTVCRTVAVGHSLAVGYVLYNEQYVPAEVSAPLIIHFGGATGSTLTLPLTVL